jgi:AcrR family transcriptional regulator
VAKNPGNFLNFFCFRGLLYLDLIKANKMDEKLNSLLERVFKLYNKFGIKSVTMDDVARELGISKKTLYQYVSDKAELVEKVITQNTDHHRRVIYGIVAQGHNAIEELLEVNRYMNQMMKEQNPTLDYDLKKYYPEIHARLVRESRKRMYESIRLNLVKGQKEGLYRQDMDIDVISRLHMTRLEYKYSSDSFTITELNSEKIMKEIFIYHLHGIASDKGRQVLNEKLG